MCVHPAQDRPTACAFRVSGMRKLSSVAHAPVVGLASSPVCVTPGCRVAGYLPGDVAGERAAHRAGGGGNQRDLPDRRPWSIGRHVEATYDPTIVLDATGGRSRRVNGGATTSGGVRGQSMDVSTTCGCASMTTSTTRTTARRWRSRSVGAHGTAALRSRCTPFMFSAARRQSRPLVDLPGAGAGPPKPGAAGVGCRRRLGLAVSPKWRCAGTPRSGSDGTRTRDLRRDRPAL